MAFLDNSGDIILDAVLTDTGRMRLARGDGSFRIAKFALSDDEIDYGLYRGSSHPDGAHPSGSAYYDLEIMQTPVLEAFTNNTSLMKHKLISMPQTNLLYLPVMKLNNKQSGSKPVKFDVTLATSTINSLVDMGGDEDDLDTNASNGVFIVAADNSTKNNLSADFPTASIIAGIRTESSDKFVRIDQGLNTTAISNQENLSPELRETQYIIRVDDRLLKLTPDNSNTLARSSFVDDDRIASYYLSKSTDGAYIKDLLKPDEADLTQTGHVIAGPKGTRLNFSLLSSTDISSSKYLFETIGGGTQLTAASSGNKYYFIDTTVRVSGATTGSSIDVPVRIMKYEQ